MSLIVCKAYLYIKTLGTDEMHIDNWLNKKFILYPQAVSMP